MAPTVDKENFQLQEFVDEFLSKSTESDASCVTEKICSLITADENLSLLTLVEFLAKSLTDDNIEKRSSGTRLLADVMHRYPSGIMLEGEIQTFVLFFSDRLKDHHSIQPIVLYGFLGLTSYQNVLDDNIMKIVQVIFHEVHVQSLIQSDRSNVFNLFNNLLKTKMNVLKRISADFLLGFIQAMDSERDPRNLLICFENSKIVLENFDISLFEEDFFEVLSCYFPIEFTPPKNNPFNISREDLVHSLRTCLTSTKQFAPYAIPLYVEKLSSDMADAKKDSLITFTDCLKIYDSRFVEPFLNDIWMQIRKDYLLSNTLELTPLYLQFIENLLLCLQNTNSSKENPDQEMDVDEQRISNTHNHIDIKPSPKTAMETLVDSFIRDCLQTLKDPELTIAKQCGEIILLISNISSSSYEKICKTVLPVIQLSLAKYKSSLQRENMLFMVLKLLGKNLSSEEKLPDMLVQFIEQVLSIYFEILELAENVQLKIICLQSMKEVLIKQDQFSGINFSVFLIHLVKPLFKEKLDQKIRILYPEIVRLVNEKYLQIFEIEIINRIKQLTQQDGVLMQSIESLKDCYQNRSYFDCHIRFLLECLNRFFEVEEILYSILDILNEALRNCEHILSTDSLFVEFTSLIFNKYIIFSKNSSRKLTETVFLFYKLLSNEQQNRILNSTVLKKEIESQNTEDKRLLQQKLIYYTGIICQLRLHDDLLTLKDSVFPIFLKYASDSQDDITANNAAICAGAIINKLSTEDESMAEIFLETLRQAVSFNDQKAAAIFVVWITKGLVLSWCRMTSRYIQYALELLCDSVVGTLIAANFEQLTTDNYLFSKESNCIVKLMYKQRFAQYVLPLLINKFETADDLQKANLITAISSTLQSMPKQFLQKYLTSLIPLLLQSITSKISTSVMKSSLNTLLSILNLNRTSMEEYVTSLVPRLLVIISHEQMAIRILVLKCLGMATSYPTHLLVPMKNDVINKLKPLLDDKKRLVRQAAAQTVNTWHLLSSGSA